jgi:hypothetical protein
MPRRLSWNARQLWTDDSSWSMASWRVMSGPITPPSARGRISAGRQPADPLSVWVRVRAIQRVYGAIVIPGVPCSDPPRWPAQPASRGWAAGRNAGQTGQHSGAAPEVASISTNARLGFMAAKRGKAWDPYGARLLPVTSTAARTSTTSDAGDSVCAARTAAPVPRPPRATPARNRHRHRRAPRHLPRHRRPHRPGRRPGTTPPPPGTL